MTGSPVIIACFSHTLLCKTKQLLTRARILRELDRRIETAIESGITIVNTEYIFVNCELIEFISDRSASSDVAQGGNDIMTLDIRHRQFGFWHNIILNAVQTVYEIAVLFASNPFPACVDVYAANVFISDQIFYGLLATNRPSEQ
jgi:hypothetical protein